MVDSKAIRQKLNKQLRISLEPHERVHVHKEPVDHDVITSKELSEMVMNNELFGVDDRDKSCKHQIKSLGQYIARICLRGGFNIPLKFEVLKR
jgi:ribosomal protein L9